MLPLGELVTLTILPPFWDNACSVVVLRFDLSGSHRSTHIASDLASRVLASQAKPQRESESQAFRIARS